MAKIADSTAFQDGVLPTRSAARTFQASMSSVKSWSLRACS
jgi:hypothetical protein